MQPSMQIEDPVIGIIQQVRNLEGDPDGFPDCTWAAEQELQKTLGLRPFALVSWRNYLALGRYEIDRARDEFLAKGVAPQIVQAEYADALCRLRAARQAERQWYRHPSLRDARLGYLKHRRKEGQAFRRLRTTKPISNAGAVAMLQFLLAEMELGQSDWQLEVLGTVIEALEDLAQTNRAHN